MNKTPKKSNRELRKSAHLNKHKLYFRSNTEHEIGEELVIAPTLKNGTQLKSSITRDETTDKRLADYYYNSAYHDRLPDNNFTYEVELKVVKKYRSKDLQEIKDTEAIAEPILPVDSEEFWDTLT